MEKIRCLIIDDEPLARELLTGFCAHLPQLKVAGVFGNALEARTYLLQHPVELLLLDINMPVLDGIGLLSTLANRPQVIFTTAYKEYAVQAFDLEVCDYLVKPFSLERFMIAIDRAAKRLQAIPTTIERAESLFIKSEGKLYQVNPDKLLFAEACGNNVKVVTTENTLYPIMTFLAFEQLLPAGPFIKIHRSYLVNSSHITLIEGNRLFIGKHEIPIGRNYKTRLADHLKI